MKTDFKFIQQGDVLINKINKLPVGAMPVKKQKNKLILAEGEATGHAHVINCPPSTEDYQLYQKDGRLYLENKAIALLTHEEHKPVNIPPGAWEIDRVREYDHFLEESRKVQD